MRSAIAVFLWALASAASARLVAVFIPPAQAPVASRPSPAPAAAPAAAPPKVVVQKVIVIREAASRTETRPQPVVQYLDGSTSVSPQWKEEYPGFFVRIK